MSHRDTRGKNVARAKVTCVQCKLFDHIVPLSKGGKHTVANTDMKCMDCNTKKGSKLEADTQLLMLSLIHI